MGLAMKSSLLFMLPILVLIALGNCGILGGEDKEPPIVWEEESLEGLVVYGFTAGDSVLHIVNLDNNAVTNIYGLKGIRSFSSSTNASNIFVSSGLGSFGGDPGYLTMINTEDWSSQIIYNRSTELENVGNEIYFISKLGHLGYDHTGNNIEVSHSRTFGKIDVVNGIVKEIDEIEVFALGIGDDSGFEVNNNQELFGFDAEFRLYKYDLTTRLKNLIFPEFDYLEHGEFELSNDGSTLFFAQGPVLDIIKNKQIGFIQSERPSHLLARKDKREVYISDPPTYTGAFNIVPKLTVYSLKQNSIIDTIDVGTVNYRMYLSPKERYLITHNRRKIFIIDLKTRELVKAIELNNEVSNFEKFYLFKQPITKGDTNEDIYIE
jgi:hypothetical protein